MHPPSLRASDLRFLLGVLLPVMTLDAVVGRSHVAVVGTLATWWGIALLEAAWPALRRSPPPLERSSPLPWLLRVFVLVEILLLAAGMRAAAQGTWPVVFGVAFTVGFITGAQGITFAHELGHGRSRADRMLAWILMGLVNYPQFMVEHYRGHHVRAATWDDPATARAGESLWRFLPRTLGGSLRGAWELEAARLAQHRKSWAGSPLLWVTLANAAFVAVLAAAGQWKVLAFWLLQSVFAVWLLETVNYIEHYGLQRRIGPGGRPEPFGPQHAWNADHVISNSLLANLQRHSDHHVHAWKAFPQLQALPAAPQLPTGYAGCILLAAVPPLWFALMHPRIALADAVK